MDRLARNTNSLRNAIVLRDIGAAIKGFLVKRAATMPEITWVGEISYINTRTFLGISFNAGRRNKEVRLAGWLVSNTQQPTWILEDGGVIVQFRSIGTDASTPFGSFVGLDQDVHYIWPPDRSQEYNDLGFTRWDYLGKLIEKLKVT